MLLRHSEFVDRGETYSVLRNWPVPRLHSVSRHGEIFDLETSQRLCKPRCDLSPRMWQLTSLPNRPQCFVQGKYRVRIGPERQWARNLDSGSRPLISPSPRPR